MRHLCALAAGFVLVAATGCSGAGRVPSRVLRLASADPAGIEHAPAVAFFIDRVARLSHGRLRIAVDERWAPGHEARLLHAVAGGDADLGWAHTRSLEEIGVPTFRAIDAPMLIDGYRVEEAVLRSSLANRMLAGTRAAGLRGLAVLSGPLTRLVGVGAPLRKPAQLRNVSFGLHDLLISSGKDVPSAALFTPRALHAFRTPISPGFVEALYAGPGGGRSALEDDLDSVFFDRYGGACPARPAECATRDPWVTTNVALSPRAAVLVGSPRRLAALPRRQRSWIATAAAQAASYSMTLGHREDQRLVGELCAAGVRFATASSRQLEHFRGVLQKAYPWLGRSASTRRAIRRIQRIRRGAPADRGLAVPRRCRRAGPQPRGARGVHSTLPDGVYRTRVTDRDLRSAGARRASARGGIATLTLRDGRWRLEVREPGRVLRTGTYAGTPLRTSWAQDGERRQESYMSIVVGRGGALRFHVVTAYDLAAARATYASHPFERIDR